MSFTFSDPRGIRPKGICTWRRPGVEFFLSFLLPSLVIWSFLGPFLGPFLFRPFLGRSWSVVLGPLKFALCLVPHFFLRSLGDKLNKPGTGNQVAFLSGKPFSWQMRWRLKPWVLGGGCRDT